MSVKTHCSSNVARWHHDSLASNKNTRPDYMLDLFTKSFNLINLTNPVQLNHINLGEFVNTP